MKHFVEKLVLIILVLSTTICADIFYYISENNLETSSDWISVKYHNNKSAIIIKIHNIGSSGDYTPLAQLSDDDLYLDTILNITIMYKGSHYIQISQNGNVYRLYTMSSALPVITDANQRAMERSMRNYQTSAMFSAYSDGYVSMPDLSGLYSSKNEFKKLKIPEYLMEEHYKKVEKVPQKSTQVYPNQYSSTLPVYTQPRSTYSGRSRNQINMDIQRTQQLLSDSQRYQNEASSAIISTQYNSLIQSHENRLYDLNNELMRADH